MATRPLLSYDDITLPYEPTKHQQHSRHPPPKKRKRNNHQKSNHWDDPRSSSNNGVSNGNGSSGSQFQEGRNVSVSEEVFVDPNDYEEGEEESRELTHEEIWDDSALVSAWEAATEEYEAYHGSEKSWKIEPVNKAPLWYNIPVESSSKFASSTKPIATAIPTASEGGAENENDSQPINFDTFVPTHNPSLDQLSSLAPPMDYAQDTNMVSQDEAFSRALNAMYWGGYWTAMYHCQRNLSKTNGISSAEGDLADENDEDVEELDAGDEDDDEFISTQR